MEEINQDLPLKPEHELFVEQLFLNNLNQVKAYLSVYPNSSYDAARSSASSLLAKPNIQNAVEKRFCKIQERHNINIDEIILKLKNLVEACEEDGDRKNLIKGIDLLNKMAGAYAPIKVENGNAAPVVINIITPNKQEETYTQLPVNPPLELPPSEPSDSTEI